MNIYIVIPAHNEAEHIEATLQSIVKQTYKPEKLVVVNDNSTDKTGEIVKTFTSQHSWISLVNHESNTKHLPGSKIIQAFNIGLSTLDKNFDILCKFDADLIFPEHYLESIVKHFQSNEAAGMVAGFCYIEQNGDWILENLTRKDHIRGALKAYRKKCFNEIGGLKPAMGWDTLDELLAQFNGWSIITDESLKVKHLKPTGKTYNKSAKYLQGEAMYRMRYGFIITIISAVKLGLKKGQLKLIRDYIVGYLKASKQKTPYLVSKEEGKYIRSLRRKGIISKIIN